MVKRKKRIRLSGIMEGQETLIAIWVLILNLRLL